MQLLYLHGFSSAAASRKANRLRAALAPLPMTILDYPSHRPDDAIATTEQAVDAIRRNHPGDAIALIGSSLGGYYAQYLAAARDDIAKVVMINPALDPQPPLEAWIGPNINSVSGEPFEFTRDDWAALARYDVPRQAITTPTLLLADAGDEVIPPAFAVAKYRGLPGKTVLYPGGDHGFAHLDEALPEIRRFLNR